MYFFVILFFPVTLRTFDYITPPPWRPCAGEVRGRTINPEAAVLYFLYCGDLRPGGRTVEDSKKFDPKKLAKLNDPRRLEYLDPDLIWERAALKEPEILIDIGAGTGFFALLFGRKMKKGKVYACDMSEKMVEWMDQNLPAESRGIVIPVRTEESAVPLSDDIADAVYMINLHHELEDPPAVLREAFRLLKRGGRVLIIDWKKADSPEGPPLEIRVTEETVEGQMRGCGFANIMKFNVLPYHFFLVGEKKTA
jgi:ubiquinone/menaquinone biosynthesis C-methylase UbiE